MTKTLRVQFQNNYSRSTKYDFLSDIEGIEVGDLVVVDSPSQGFSVVAVVEVLDEVTTKAKKWVVDKVDLHGYQTRLEKQKKKDELMKKLDARYKALDKLAMFDRMAENDPAMKALLDEYKSI